MQIDRNISKPPHLRRGVDEQDTNYYRYIKEHIPPKRTSHEVHVFCFGTSSLPQWLFLMCLQTSGCDPGFLQ